MPTIIDDPTTQLRQENATLRSERYRMQSEIDVLAEQLRDEGLPRATSWLQTKVWSQRFALNRLTKRVTAQRAVLRHLEETGRGVTQEDWEAIRAKATAPELEAFTLLEWTLPKES